MVKSLKFIKGLRLNAVANNVAVIKKWVPNIHPEQFGFPSDNLVGLEATGLPITRSIGFNLNIRFKNPLLQIFYNHLILQDEKDQ
jgi:hypothetical protein